MRVDFDDLVQLTGRSIDVSLPFHDGTMVDTAEITFRYDIDNIRSFVAAADSFDEINSTLRETVAAQLSHDFSMRYTDQVESPDGKGSKVPATRLRENLGEMLGGPLEFDDVSRVFGVTLWPDPSFQFTGG